MLPLAVSCSSVAQMYPGPERSHSEVARIAVIERLQNYDRQEENVTLSMVDGEAVATKDHRQVALLPGKHRLTFKYFRHFNPRPELYRGRSSSPYRGTAGTLYREREIARNEKLIEEETSSEGSTIEVELRAGEVYRIGVEFQELEEAPEDQSWDITRVVRGPATEKPADAPKKYWRAVLRTD